MRVWSFEDGSNRAIAILPDPPNGLAISPDLRLAAIVRRDGVVIRHDLRTGEPATLPLIDDIQMSCALFLGDGRLLVGGGRKSPLWCYSANGGPAEPFGPGGDERGKVRALDRASRRGLIAAAGWGDQITVLDEGTGEPRDQWPGRGATTMAFHHSVAFSPDERRLAVGSDQGLLRVWDIAELDPERDQGEPQDFTGHTGRVTSVAWSPDGRLLASGSSDGSARLWDAHRGELLLVLRAHRGPVNAVLFATTKHGDCLLTAGDDGAIQAWPTDIDEVAALASERVAALDYEPVDFADRVVEAAIRFGLTEPIRQVAWRLAAAAESTQREPNLDLALRAARHAVEFSTGRGVDHRRALAKVHFLRRDYEQAVRCQEEAISRVPDDQPELRARCSAELERYRQAAGR